MIFLLILSVVPIQVADDCHRVLISLEVSRVLLEDIDMLADIFSLNSAFCTRLFLGDCVLRFDVRESL